LKSGFAGTILVKAIAVSGFLAVGAYAAQAADLSLPVTGNLLGSVADSGGIPQMGATVELFNKYQRLLAKTVTAPDGRFGFAALPADLYSVRVSLASFLPASRDKIAVKPGLDSVLQIHLATLFSNIELSYTIPTSSMSNDWKWVLRSSPATRPITRILDEETGASSSAELHSRIFSGTHAMLSINGGDGGLIDSDSTQTDLGTGFVVSTNLLGKNQLQVGGTFGQGFGPAAMGLCAIYSRSDNGGLGEPPEITLTVSQLGILGPQMPGSQSTNAVGLLNGTNPMIRDMSLSIYEVADPVDGVHLEYGMTGESVESVQHTSRVSPFARLTMDAGVIGQFIAAYSDGGRPDELSAHQAQQNPEMTGSNDDLLSAVNALARLPQLSERDGRLELQRTQNYELGYSKAEGSRTWAASTFYEDVSNGRVYVAGDTAPLNVSDLLSDGVSTTSTYNVGHYERSGYLASVDQRVNDSLDVAIAYGRMGGFTTDESGVGQSWGVQEKFLNERNHNLATANVHARLPVMGTQITANYGWVDAGAVVPSHVFTTQNTYVSPGLNIVIRQPLPSFFGMPGRLELTADLRNLLAQGYLPLDGGDSRTLLVVQAPRAIRGSLNFIF
jgi:Carboxypeptidase regulatory-like domain